MRMVLDPHHLIAVPTDVLLAAMNEEVGFGLAEAA